MAPFAIFETEGFDCILQTLGQKYNPIDLGLYRDDGLALFHCKTDKEMDNIRKDFIKIFKLLSKLT